MPGLIDRGTQRRPLREWHGALSKGLHLQRDYRRAGTSANRSRRDRRNVGRHIDDARFGSERAVERRVGVGTAAGADVAAADSGATMIEE